MMDFFASYLRYAGAGHSEPPIIFHRWTAASIIGALLGRQAYLPFGHGRIYPNQYIMLMGTAGSRKSTAINIGAKLLKSHGYTRFASDKTSKERFLMDMSPGYEEVDPEDLIELTLDEPSEIFVVAEEFTDFIGENNTEFSTMLTKLWDNPDDYKHPKIHGKCVEVEKPTVNILAGNTHQNFALAFPTAALGNGFLSRIILVHGSTTGRKVTFPPAPDEAVKQGLVHHIGQIRKLCVGEVVLSSEVRGLCDRIYQEYVPIEDTRFSGYATRRFTHLLKLSMVLACSRLSMEISVEDMLKANTMLHVTELRMPKALGEFGKSKYADVSQSIMEILEAAKNPVSVNELWRKVSKDLSKLTELYDIIKGLQQAERIQVIQGKKPGYLPNHKHKEDWKEELLLLDWITDEELTP